MPVRITHLSDLHYGRSFHRETWESVIRTVYAFEPDVLVVSGDFVDDPRADHLRSAKAEIDAVAKNARAALLTVPGNHDVFISGNAELGRRPAWYRAIFLEGPEPALVADSAAPASDPGFQSPERGFWRNVLDRAAVFLQIGAHAVPSPQPRPPPPRPPGAVGDDTEPPVLRKLAGVLFVLLDSNSTEREPGLATGRVSAADLARLDRELQSSSGQAYLARVAIIHHHILPIAATGGRFIGSEAFMVLHNAGDVLSVLARHRFDLVLHGHKHRAQFSRVDFVPEDAEGYPIAVASAGCAALRPEEDKEDPSYNSFNQVTIEDNGRLTVQSLHYGFSGMGPNPNGKAGSEVKTYVEPLGNVKRRAHIGALRRQGIIAKRRELAYDVREDGTIILSDLVEGLQRVQQGGARAGIRMRPQVIAIPKHGRLARSLAIDPASRAAGFEIAEDPEAPGDPHRKVVVLPEPLGSDPVTYTVEYACANSVMMTEWEADQRADTNGGKGGDWDKEYVGTLVSHPLEELTLALKLPAPLRGVKPNLRCQRRRGFPNFPIGTRGIVEPPKLEDGAPPPLFDEDLSFRREEEERLSFDLSTGRWQITIRRPIVGYRYRLYWALPRSPRPAEPVAAQTQQWREALLAMADRTVPADRDVKAAEKFAELADLFRRELGSGLVDEATNVSLFVYDAKELAVRPVLWNTVGRDDPDWRKFLIPLGEGIAGASFLQRAPVPWDENQQKGVFVKPQALPGAVSRTMLAIPIFHPEEQDRTEPSFFGTIGVVSFGSSDLATGVPQLLNSTQRTEDVKRMKLLRGLSQAVVFEMTQQLLRTGG